MVAGEVVAGEEKTPVVAAGANCCAFEPAAADRCALEKERKSAAGVGRW